MDAAAQACPSCGAAQMATEVPPQIAFQQQKWSGFWRRFGAQFIDGFVIYIPIIVVVGLTTVLFAKKLPPSASFLLLIIEELVIYVIYQGWLNSSEKMATFGRRAVGIAMVDATTGGPVGYWRACFRALLGFFSNLLIVPNLVQLVTHERRSVADYLAGTAIVQRKQGATGVVVAIVVGMMAVGILGIVAAIAIPAYQDYTVRARVSQALMIDVAAAKQLVESNAAQGATDLGAGRMSAKSPGVESMSIDPNGAISIQMNVASKSVQFSLVPSSAGGPLVPGHPINLPIQWRCKVAEPRQDRWVPSECRI
jgi:type IV pilus assembly protein PilA